MVKERDDRESEKDGYKAPESGMEAEVGQKKDTSHSSVSSFWQLCSSASFSPCDLEAGQDGSAHTGAKENQSVSSRDVIKSEQEATVVTFKNTGLKNVYEKDS